MSKHCHVANPFDIGLDQLPFRLAQGFPDVIGKQRIPPKRKWRVIGARVHWAALTVPQFVNYSLVSSGIEVCECSWRMTIYVENLGVARAWGTQRAPPGD